ncbi:hypothetical protein ID866_4522 [Astraeus odoratus]|nr:hypothetical protein ID866_4522 [Astraeus odoratus]
MHHRGSSPVFIDAPGFLPLRRLKPLPKRRRTSDEAAPVLMMSARTGAVTTTTITDAHGNADHHQLFPSANTNAATAAATAAITTMPVSPGLFVGGIARQEELSAAHDVMSSAPSDVAPHSKSCYGTSLLGSTSTSTTRSTASHSVAPRNPPFFPLRSGDAIDDGTLDLSAVYQRYVMQGRMRSGGQDEDSSEGDSTDHFQQPGNAKKRKVPVNTSRAAQGRARGDMPESAGDEGTPDGPFATGLRALHPGLDVLATPPPPPLSSSSSSSMVAQMPKRGKMTLSTLAGLQHKELLGQRKRQLAAVLGALSLGDTLALDQALSTHVPFVSTMPGTTSDPPQKVRLSRRRGPRLARAAKAQISASNTDKKAKKGISFPTVQFTFSYPSPTSDRLMATKEEMRALRSRFEAELARQATKAAQASATDTKQTALAASKPPRPKLSEKAPRRSRTTTAIDQSAEPLNPPPLGKSRGGKKKNTPAASDLHDRKNYTPPRPSALALANQAHATQGSYNSLVPYFLRFLSANIPPRRRKQTTTTPTTQIADPAEEWICPQCEHSLLYSDGVEYKRAIRNRKRILRRRQRAQERAAGSLSAPKTPAKVPLDDGVHDDDYSQLPAQSPSISKPAEWKEGPDIKGIKGQFRTSPS